MNVTNEISERVCVHHAASTTPTPRAIRENGDKTMVFFSALSWRKLIQKKKGKVRKSARSKRGGRDGNKFNNLPGRQRRDNELDELYQFAAKATRPPQKSDAFICIYAYSIDPPLVYSISNKEKSFSSYTLLVSISRRSLNCFPDIGNVDINKNKKLSPKKTNQNQRAKIIIIKESNHTHTHTKRIKVVQ